MLLLFLESPEENITNVINDTTTSPTLKEIERTKEQAIYLRLVYQNALDNIYIETNEEWIVVIQFMKQIIKQHHEHHRTRKTDKEG